jgi:hypothetical protein
MAAADVEDRVHLARALLELVVELARCCSTLPARMEAKFSGGRRSWASASMPVRSMVAPALRTILSIATFSVSAWMTMVSTPRLRARSTAWSNRRAP